MFKAIIALSFVFAAQAQAFDRHEIVSTEPCAPLRVVKTNHGDVKTQTVLTYLACQDGKSKYFHTEISLPGNSPVVQETVEMLCKGLRTHLQSKRIDIEMSACMKE